VEPSKPGALVVPRLARAYEISSSVGGVHKKAFSSSKMMGENRFSISFSIKGFEEVKRVVK
jgi:hypothetical protein